MSEWTDFDVTIPFARTTKDGTRETRDVSMCIPAISLEIAQVVANDIAYAVVTNQEERDLLDLDLGPCRWKVGRDGPAVAPRVLP